MKLFKCGTRSTERGPKTWFSGTAWLDEIAVAEIPSKLRIHKVTFEPGARTVWHSHPVGQVLHIISGDGWVQRAGGAALLVQPGDSVWIAPDEKHWHGATSDRPFVHLAVQEAAADGTEAMWFDHVSNADYQRLETTRNAES